MRRRTRCDLGSCSEFRWDGTFPRDDGPLTLGHPRRAVRPSLIDIGKTFTETVEPDDFPADVNRLDERAKRRWSAGNADLAG